MELQKIKQCKGELAIGSYFMGKDNLKTGFSLIEILISLIIISLLVGAFAPIITKKLKASDISIGSFGNGGTSYTTLERQVTKEDCEKYDALFIPAAMNGGQRNLCVTKYNMGDKELPLAEGIKKLSAGSECTGKDKGNCCWSGTTSSSCGTSGNDGNDYSGCDRTVCQFAAANASCASYAPNEENEGRWRLANKDELNNWSSNLVSLNNNKGTAGLQLCDSENATSGSVMCQNSANGEYLPNTLWSMTTEEADTHIASTLTNGSFTSADKVDALGASARCVLDSIEVDVSELPTGNGIGNATKDPFYGEPTSQEDCDKIVAIFIDKKMSGANRNICVSKYNVGDAGPDGFGPPIPDSFEQYIMGIGQTCSYSGSCCWKGKTSGTCGLTGNAGANYSGCNRTVCQWAVANAACRLYNAFGATAVGAWRLPSKAEMSVWAQYLSTINDNKGSNGLQLCTTSVKAGYVQCSNGLAVCGGAYGGKCHPSYMWSGTMGSTGMYFPFYDNLVAIAEHQQEHAFSARCVYDGITKADNYAEDLNDFDDSNAPKDEPKSQADCEKLTSIFIHKKYAGGSRNLCMSKYNVGDSGPSGSGPSIPSSYSNYVMNVGQTCKYSNYCCWKGKTSGTCGIAGNAGANYSGCNRTVCQWNVANESCISWTAGGKTPAGYWRLPTKAELASMANYLYAINNNKGKDGIQLCTNALTGDSVQCSNGLAVCGGAYGGKCHPSYMWSGTMGSTGMYFPFYDNLVAIAEHQQEHAFSARCVYDGSAMKTTDTSGYDDSNAPDDEPKSQTDCDKLVAIFVHKKLAGGMRNLCITKYNVGDNGADGQGPQLPSGYTKITPAQSCPSAGKCCIQGITSGTCGLVGNAGANYSGCGRTVCQWAAADAACKAYTASGKTQSGYWRLPTSFELSTLSKSLDIINNNRGKNGLQLCTANVTGGFVQCSNGTACSAGYGGKCHPSYMWSGTMGSTNFHFPVYDAFIPNSEHQDAHMFSARCVYDGQKY